MQDEIMIRRLTPARLSTAALIMCVAVAPPAARADSASVTERLIELLVQKGVLPRDQAAALLQQAQAEGQTKPAKAARPPRAAKATPAAPPAGAAAAGTTASQAASAPPAPPGSVRVTYVPESVRNQIAEQVRKEVMDEARTNGWAQPNVIPEWVQRTRITGDMRIRGELDNFPSGNYDQFPDFNTINNSSGFNTNTQTPNAPNPPLLDTTQNRSRARVRARLGVITQIDDGVSGEIRIGTGNDSSPVSTNQTFGYNGGNFSKYAIWLDRAYTKFDPFPYLTVNVGRAPNPFWTTNLLYYDELNFDGISAQGSYHFNDRVGAFLNTGAFPVFNQNFNFASTPYPTQAASRNKYLFAVQGGGDWRITDDYAAKFAVGYFTYSNIQGRLSSPCSVTLTSDACSTDNSRANFVQFGNTLFPIRNFATDPNNPTAATPQYYGLASNFNVIDLHGRFDINNFRPIGIALEGDFVKNLAFNKSAIAARGPVNNLGSGGSATGPFPYQGGDTGYLARITVGTPEIAKRWDWNVSLAYKYVASDAVLDALTDPDFHLGGTNAKGYILTGNLGIARNTWLTGRLLNANQVSGQPYAVDVIQFDLSTRF